MKILLLGHDGFIGQEVYNLFSTLEPVEDILGLSYPGVDLCNSDVVQQIAKYFTPATAVIMCAGVKRQLGDDLDIFQQNLMMVENVCKILQQCPVKQFVYFSSAAVYGEDIHNLNISEETQIQPRTFYGIAKYASERLLWKVIAKQPQTALALLRPPLIYGIGDKSMGYGPTGFLNKMLKDEEISLWGDATELREFLYVKDIARIVYEVVRSNFRGVLNPVSGKSHSFQQLLDQLVTVTGKTPKITRRDRTNEKVDNVFSNILLKKHFPSLRFTTLDIGIRDMLENGI
jgi:UDP-glucose 4-epimerase